MNENRVIALRQKGAIDDPLTEILRVGAAAIDWSSRAVLSLQSLEEIAPSNPGIKHLGRLRIEQRRRRRFDGKPFWAQRDAAKKIVKQSAAPRNAARIGIASTGPSPSALASVAAFASPSI